MKLVVAGTRQYNNPKVIYDEINNIRKQHKITEILQGGCPNSADQTAEKYAKEKGITSTTINADWDNLGKKAGPIRNQELAEKGDILLAFWDGKSPGTRDMIYKMRKKGKETIVKKILKNYYFEWDW